MAALHPKNAAQKHRLLTAEHWLCMERARYYTKAHRETRGLDPAFGFEFWRHMSFPDVYRLVLEDHVLVGVERLWGSPP